VTEPVLERSEGSERSEGMVLLGEKAYCRFGDKGDTGMFVLIPYDAADFETLVASVTPERVAEHLGNLSPSLIVCVPCPNLRAMVVVVRGSLRGGVTQSLALDAHGKTRSGYLLGMHVPWNGVTR
jgi:hypothetical protein